MFFLGPDHLSAVTSSPSATVKRPAQVRRATASDGEGVAQVHFDSWKGAYRGIFPDVLLDNPEQLERRRALWNQRLGDPADLRTTFVAVDETSGRVVGFISGGVSRDKDATPEAGEIYALYTDPSVWRTGTGSALMVAACSALTDAGFKFATLWVLEQNDRARRFYEQVGWTPEGLKKDYVTGGIAVPELRYHRKL